MMPILKIAFSVLTSKPAALLAELATVVLAIALIGAKMETAALSRQLGRATNTIGQLKGSLDFQNKVVSDLGTKTAAAQKLARGLVAASAAAHAGDTEKAAALVAAPVEIDLAKACAAADTAILENIK